MSFLTFYVLFEEDVWILVIPMALDDVFMFFNCIALALFAIDLICSSIAIWGYFFGFYFWLDLIAVISLITDITWIWYWVIGVSTDLSKYVDSNGNFDPRQLEGWSSDSQRAEQALLIIRKIRLVRVVKLYKYAVQAFGKSDTKKAEKSMIGKSYPTLLRKDWSFLFWSSYFQFQSLTDQPTQTQILHIPSLFKCSQMFLTPVKHISLCLTM